MKSLLAAVLLAAPASAGVLHLEAYDEAGRRLDAKALIAYVSAPVQPPAVPKPESSALFVTDLEGRPVPGRPWWVARSSMPAVGWEGSGKVKLSFPWPVPVDGFSHVEMDNNGEGFADGRTVLLNEEIATTAYRRLRASLELRRSRWEPRYKPTRQAETLFKQAQQAVAEATAAAEPAARAALFDKALTFISYSWQQLLFEHGKQIARSKAGKELRWGLTLDESFAGRMSEHKWIIDRVEDSGADWVRLVFRVNPPDFVYGQPASFTLYDPLVDQLRKKGLKVMGSVLDSALWPKGLSADLYVARAKNLAEHYKGRISSWEVASEPNGNWLGGWRSPLPDELILESVQKAAAELKKSDPAPETVATLYWWEGTAKDDRHPTFAWLDWAVPKGFGKDIDVIALSVYPNDNPLGIAFDPVFSRLAERFPDKRLMLGGFGYVEGDSPQGYWWLQPASVQEARKDLINLYTGAACSLPRSLGGGFWFPTLSQMLPPGKKATPIYQVYKRTLGSIR